MELLELPSEMLLHVATYLNAKSLTFLSETCKDFNYITSIDTLWQALCQHDYNISSNKGWNLTYKQIYTKILCRYPILGYQRIAHQPFGGLLHIVWAEGEIKVTRIFAGKSSLEDFVLEPAYSLTWNKDSDSLEAKCTHSRNGSAPAVISKTQKGSYFVLRCEVNKCYNCHRRPSHTYGQSDKRIAEGFKDHPGAFKSFNTTVGYSYPLLPMEFPPIPSHFPITPGLYRGNYGGHGVEIIQVKVCHSNPYLMECLKITGDPNVPAGNPSVMVCLDKPVILSKEEQSLMENITDADEERPEEAYTELLRNENNRDWRQPFFLPHNCFERGCNPPKTCVARYLGNGTISGHNFNHPSLCRVHVAKFNNDTFGILWLDLFCFIMMHREKHFF